MNDFIRDNDWQLGQRDRLLKPFYLKMSQDGRFVFMDKGQLADILQREMAIDTIMQTKGNGTLGIEEKIVRWPKRDRPYTAYALETMSCTVPGREREGWMCYSRCDVLLYCFMQKDGNSLIAHAIPFKKLRDWFFSDDLHTLLYPISQTEQINHTECRVVPIVDVWNNVPGCKEYTLIAVVEKQPSAAHVAVP